MKSKLVMLSLMVAAAGLPVWAGPPGLLAVGGATGGDVRGAGAGRRLTPAELAQLRQQVRQQWSPSQNLAQSAGSPAGERMMPDAPSQGALTAPRSQRP
jgi:hypothetical protein